MIGTIINAGAVITGSLTGLIIKKRLNENLVIISFQVIGVFTLLLGFMMGMKSHNLLIQIISLLSGAWIGQWIDFEKFIVDFEQKIRRKFNNDNLKFTEGMVVAFLLFCAGSMTILGALDEGISGNPHLLLIKSVMDGISALALASVFGWGVIFSVIPLFIYQAAITLFAKEISDVFDEKMIDELTATGGLILIALAISILEIKKMRVMNMLPALITVLLTSYLFKLLNL